jgi:hypothetical protein
MHLCWELLDVPSVRGCVPSRTGSGGLLLDPFLLDTTAVVVADLPEANARHLRRAGLAAKRLALWGAANRSCWVILVGASGEAQGALVWRSLQQ